MSNHLDHWTFDDRVVRELPADSTVDPPGVPPRPRLVLDAAYSRVHPSPSSAPALVAHVPDVAEALGLTPEAISDPQFTQIMAGNQQLPTMKPYAACYGGHQFGHWAGQLGDGRAITLGEAITPSGDRLEVQLKGAGRTPYSRRADGRAVLRSSIREFLCSEAMHHLGVPTTRALSLVTTGDPVLRDMFYDGRAKYEPGAIVSRVAPSFLRFGSYQIFASRDDRSTLRALVDHTLRWHFPDIDPHDPHALVHWAHEVARRTADLVVHWQRVGFVHGVLNTDNMSILGLTIDYGPYGWLEDFDPDWTPNTTDAERRRYRFGQQPQVGAWNLARLLEAVSILLDDPEPLGEALQTYGSRFGEGFVAMMRAKLGWTLAQDDDPDLIDALITQMQSVETDMTVLFRALADVDITEDAAPDTRFAPLRNAFYDEAAAHRVAPQWHAWLETYATRSRAEPGPPSDRRTRMNAANPKFVLRNALAQVAIDEAEAGDPSEIYRLQQILRHPYADQPDTDPKYAAKRPEWARHRPGCSMLSCSS